MTPIGAGRDGVESGDGALRFKFLILDEIGCIPIDGRDENGVTLKKEGGNLGIPLTEMRS